jgi:hypothetical protein
MTEWDAGLRDSAQCRRWAYVLQVSALEQLHDRYRFVNR